MTKKSSPIHFILTGGTIDSFYDGTKDTAVPNKTSIIPQFVKSLKLYEKVKFTEVCMKDSRDLNLTDLKKILKAAETSPCERIIITHGTYTMPDTARYLQKNLKRKDQIIILTGSLIPLNGFSLSDAPFSLGYSVAKTQDLPQGIYVCMNGRIFAPEEVTKIINEGRFASIFKD